MHIYILTLARINCTGKKQDSLHSRYLYTLGQTCTISSVFSHFPKLHRHLDKHGFGYWMYQIRQPHIFFFFFSLLAIVLR